MGHRATMRVSTEALIEADAIPVKREPVTVRMWIRRSVLALVAMAAVGGATWGIMAWLASGRAQAALNSAMEQAKTNARLKPSSVASIYRGAGQFYGASGKTDEATKHFIDARAKLGSPDDSGRTDLARDAALIELALAWMEYAESQGADWSDPVRQTLTKLGSVDAKQTALREIGTRLLKKNQGEKALWLANQLTPATPTLAAEPLPVPDKKDPGDKDNKGEKGEKGMSKAVAISPLVGQQIAFLLANGKTADAAKIEPPPDTQDKAKEPKEVDLAVRLGYAKGKARLGEFAAARDIAMMKGSELHQLEASVAIAAIAVGQNKMPQAKECTQDALKVFNTLQTRRSTPSPWIMIQLAAGCAFAPDYPRRRSRLLMPLRTTMIRKRRGWRSSNSC